MGNIQRAIENMSNYVRWGMPSVRKKDAETAISAMQELQQYQELEKEGRLMKLPCAVGDTVYEIIHDDIPVQVDYIAKYQVEDISTRGILYGGGWVDFTDLDDVYFNREEAEKRLRELLEGRQNEL